MDLMSKTFTREGRRGMEPLSQSSKIEEVETFANTKLRHASLRGNLTMRHSIEDFDESQELSNIDVLSTLRALPEVTRAKYFAFAEYGEGNWALDLLALPHNAVRHESSQFSMLLTKFQDNQNEGNNSKDVELLHNWWNLFRIFVLEMFDAEETTLFHVLGERLELPSQFRDQQRSRTKMRIVKSLREVGKCFAVLVREGGEAVLEHTVEAHSDFSYRLFSYFYSKELILPRMIEQVCSQRECHSIEQRMLDQMKRHPNTKENVVLLTRWMSEEQLKTWKSTNLSAPMRVSYRLWRQHVEKKELKVSNLIVT
mmetsp:Transcript_9091/g.27349  ORF Transcript_9091/g.27349 Transcript_9091/m.27349 type:complete len:312 (+) Transcript_9091:194-1129(+)|eukprot:CAMPEP_0198730782 /NCGR_PEP_ID=MMETSP1475-20131203/26254_1 /TAXON_ID= ORGANISM="Unidentified sp., Strain CCMP1999" /NCGR_SAMPLE_ID=MMETSP1475 /ASSEMBLY_ACC=CAM_ASM_001111 /LENGTH=311 /DNA_ID=CAMNT_0044493645 /DNA_START=164 /DNA_END=1099 /DNA_ORIENTATION=-